MGNATMAKLPAILKKAKISWTDIEIKERLAAAAEAAAAAAVSSGGAGPSSDNGAPAPPRRRPTLLPSVTDDPPPVAGARRVSLTFRPGEGLLLTGLDGRVEEIEPNFDLNV